MKPQTIVLIAVACVAGLLVSSSLALVVAWQVFGRSAPRFAQPVPFVQQGAVAQNDVFIEVAPPIQVERPVTREEIQQLRKLVTPAQDYTFTGPHTHANLTVFLIRGPDAMKDQKVITLQEALQNNLAMVHETRTGQLAIDNYSNTPLFIQSGDIVKGGIQDRVLPYDQLVPPQTNRLPLAALCVEQGRSFPRGQELSTSFATATEQLPGKRLKLAAFRNSQNDVWKNVQQTQVNLTRNVGSSVQSAESQTSLQLTLENSRVQEVVHEYLLKLTGIPEGKNDVIGFAVAINGKVQTADIYASSNMFQKLWPKLLKASAVEALAEMQKDSSFDPPSTQEVQDFLTGADVGQGYSQEVVGQMRLIRQESARHLVLDTCDTNQQNLVLHRSFVAK